jgi:gas vesicle protein
MSKGKFALGALLGAAAGIVAGMLTAPKAGKDTRADLKLRADELRSEADRKANDVKAHGEKVYKEARQTVDEYRDRAERAVNSAKSELKDDGKTDAKKKS